MFETGDVVVSKDSGTLVKVWGLNKKHSNTFDGEEVNELLYEVYVGTGDVSCFWATKHFKKYVPVRYNKYKKDFYKRMAVRKFLKQNKITTEEAAILLNKRCENISKGAAFATVYEWKKFDCPIQTQTNSGDK